MTSFRFDWHARSGWDKSKDCKNSTRYKYIFKQSSTEPRRIRWHSLDPTKPQSPLGKRVFILHNAGKKFWTYCNRLENNCHMVKKRFLWKKESQHCRVGTEKSLSTWLVSCSRKVSVDSVQRYDSLQAILVLKDIWKWKTTKMKINFCVH